MHVALPIDVQHGSVDTLTVPVLPSREQLVPDLQTIKHVADELVSREEGIVFVGQGVRGAVEQLVELAELLDWPIITTPQAKGYIPDTHPLLVGVYGFAGHEAASNLIAEGDANVLLIVGSSLGETATNNYNVKLTENRFTIQLDFDETVFNRKYTTDLPVHGDINLSLAFLIEELRNRGLTQTSYEHKLVEDETNLEDYNTKNVMLSLQNLLPPSTRYTIDIGEFMAYVINHMSVKESDTYGINVHFGAMGTGIGSAIGSKLAEPDRPVVCVTGDGCFFMHGMEILTAKEYNLPILFVVMNNARLGMVYHGHALQFKRTHPSFEQQQIDISAMAAGMGVPSFRVNSMDDLNQATIDHLMNGNDSCCTRSCTH